jgi:PPM family protein phosphatase
MTVAVKAATDIGLKRTQNEDSHGIWVPEDEARLARRGVLLVVADGMGGYRAGEVASRLAVETVVGVYRATDEGDVPSVLRHAVEEANRVVHRESLANPDKGGMGTTCTALVVRGTEAWVAHVGDSRAYLVRGKGIEQVTRDHSLVAQFVREGQLTPEEARVDPRRNVVTRSLGVAPSVEVDVESVPHALRPDDTFLLCSDGLHGQVLDPEMAEAVAGRNLERACQDLIALARERGGPDNITVMLARVAGAARGRAPAKAAAAKRPVSSRTTLLLLIAVLVGLLVVVAAIGWLLMRNMHGSRDRRAALPAVTCSRETSWA